MYRTLLALAILAGGAAAFAQQKSGSSGSAPRARAPYRAAVPAGNTTVYGGGGYGYGGGYGGGTAAGNAMNGMASMISAQGSANLSNSAAAINYSQARAQEIVNRQDATDAYFSMRAVNRQQRAIERGPHPSMEQLARIAADGAPRKLSMQQVDQVTGSVNWPDLLQQDPYAEERTEMEKIVSKRASYGALDYSEQKHAQDTIDAMLAKLKAKIRDVTPQQYSDARSFLRSLMYSLTKTDLG